MSEHDPVPDGARCQPNALTSAQNNTAMRPDEGPKNPHTALLVSAWASLITALTGVAVVLLDHL